MRLRRQHLRRGDASGFRPGDGQLAGGISIGYYKGIPCRMATFRSIMVGEGIVVRFTGRFFEVEDIPNLLGGR